MILEVTGASRMQKIFRRSPWPKKRTCGTMPPNSGRGDSKSNCFFLDSSRPLNPIKKERDMNHPRKQSKAMLAMPYPQSGYSFKAVRPAAVRRHSKMLIRSLRIAVLLTLSSFAMAQQKSHRPTATAVPGNDTCAATFTSGVDHNATSYCVTVNGNIVQFSRGGDEYIRVGGFAEGYGICDLSSNIGYFDYAVYDSGNWLAASFNTTATRAVSTRSSSDGVWQIKNTITKVAATAADPGSAKVTMQIKNLTTVERSIRVFRFADVDFSRGGVDYYTNDFDFTRDTATGLGGNQIDFSTGLSLTNNTFLNIGASALTQGTSDGPDPCGLIFASHQPFVGDGSLVQQYGLIVSGLSSGTISLTYKPI
jgi:hypothetical protein